MKIGIVEIESREVREKNIDLIKNVEIEMRVIERRVWEEENELIKEDFDGIMEGVVMEMRNDVIGNNMIRLW